MKESEACKVSEMEHLPRRDNLGRRGASSLRQEFLKLK